MIRLTGFNLGALRKASGAKLSEVSLIAGVSVSYLSRCVNDDLPLNEHYANVVFPWLVDRYFDRARRDMETVQGILAIMSGGEPSLEAIGSGALEEGENKDGD
jgi:hypothetical protein